ncbi:hypothetical protein M0R72_03910 [Candidatus Pacearchaeota archaeon]|nr:hypothetical protein [Candidatus Pacearchaeota archaeon]
MVEKKPVITKEEIESKILALKPHFAIAGSTLEIVEIKSPKVILKFIVPDSFPNFKVQGKMFGAKEFAIETKDKIKKNLEGSGIVASFID